MKRLVLPLIGLSALAIAVPAAEPAPTSDTGCTVEHLSNTECQGPDADQASNSCVINTWVGNATCEMTVPDGVPSEATGFARAYAELDAPNWNAELHYVIRDKITGQVFFSRDASNTAPISEGSTPTEASTTFDVALPQEGGGEVRVVEFDPLGGRVDTHGAGDGISPSTGAGGLAVNSSTGQVYVSAIAPNSRVFILDEAALPSDPKQVVSQFGGDGAADGQFGALGPRGVGVYESTGNVYVGDRGNNRVQRFDSGGGFVSKFGSAGAAGGQFNRPWGVAVDQSDGSLYVVDQRNRRVQKFDSSGSFQRMWGWGVQDGTAAFQVCTSSCMPGLSGSGDGQFAGEMSAHPAVDPNTGDVYVPDPVNSRVQKFDSSGNFLAKFGTAGAGDGQFAANSPTHLAVDSLGNVYVVDPGNGRVQKFDSSGGFVADFAASTLTGSDPHAVAVDPADDHVYVATRADGSGEVVCEVTGTHTPLGGALSGSAATEGASQPFNNRLGCTVD